MVADKGYDSDELRRYCDRHTDTGNGPADQDSASTCTGGHILRKPKYAAADDRTDHKRHQQAEPQFGRRGGTGLDGGVVTLAMVETANVSE